MNSNNTFDLSGVLPNKANYLKINERYSVWSEPPYYSEDFQLFFNHRSCITFLDKNLGIGNFIEVVKKKLTT